MINYETDQTLCGGSLVSDIHVITAAHCLNSGRVLESVIVGETDIRKEIDEVKNETMSYYLAILSYVYCNKRQRFHS